MHQDRDSETGVERRVHREVAIITSPFTLIKANYNLFIRIGRHRVRQNIIPFGDILFSVGFFDEFQLVVGGEFLIHAAMGVLKSPLQCDVQA